MITAAQSALLEAPLALTLPGAIYPHRTRGGGKHRADQRNGKSWRLCGAHMIGYLADRTGGYTAGLMYLISCGVLASGLILSLRTTRPEPDTPEPDSAPRVKAAARPGI